MHPRGAQEYALPTNVVATTSAAAACAGAQYAIHAVPVQHSRAFLLGIKVTPGAQGLCVDQCKQVSTVARVFPF